MSNEYSVCQFFSDGNSEYVARWVSAEVAVQKFWTITISPGARLGAIERLIVTDGDDHTNLEWVRGVGITFPPELVGFEYKPKG